MRHGRAGWRALLVGLVGLLAGEPAWAEAEFAPFGAAPAETDRERAFTAQGAPALNLGQECDDDGDCWPVIRTGTGEEVERFAEDDTVYQLARARYAERAFLVISYECDGKDCREHLYRYRLDADGDFGRDEVSTDLRRHFRGQTLGSLVDLLPGTNERPALLSMNVRRDGELLLLTEKGLVQADDSGAALAEHPAPVPLTHGRLQNALNGGQGAIAVDENNRVWLSDGERWLGGDLRLPEHGDRSGIFTVYPVAEDRLVAGVYRYANIYNKGLFLLHARLGDESVAHGPVLLSHGRNVGWDPEVFPLGDRLLLVARDSTHGGQVQVAVPRERLGELSPEIPPEFPAGENRVELHTGAGIQQLYWEAQSKVKKDDTTHTRVDYRIDRSLLLSGHFQARVGDTRLTLAYLQDRAGERAEASGGETRREAVEYLMGTVDFQGLFAPSSGLRLAFRRHRTSGVAEVTGDTATEYEPFSVRYRQYGLYNTLERGHYWGAEYTRYRMPSAVGFSDASKAIVYSDFDPDFGIEKYSLVYGYDAQSYAKRYEANYGEWYLSGKAGLGMGQADVSSRVRNDAKAATGESELNGLSFVAFDAMLESGLIWQRRWRPAAGLGFQLLAGYRVSGSHMGAGQGEESDSQEGLSLEFTRYDIWHGPFARLNLVF